VDDDPRRVQLGPLLERALDGSRWLTDAHASSRPGMNTWAASTQAPWSAMTRCTVAPGMASAILIWRQAGTSWSCTVTTTPVGTSTSVIHRRLSKLPTAQAACRMAAWSPRCTSRDAQRPNGVLCMRPRRAAPMTWLRIWGGVMRAAADMPSRLVSNRRSDARRGVKLRDVAQSTSPDTRSEWRRHTSWVMGPPIE
jgi:hypothetical protein